MDCFWVAIFWMLLGLSFKSSMGWMVQNSKLIRINRVAPSVRSTVTMNFVSIHSQGIPPQSLETQSSSKDLSFHSTKLVLFPWRHPLYPSSELKKGWETTDNLLTIGASGISLSHINTIVENAASHNFVKVKLASNRYSSMAIANTCMQDERLQKAVEVVEVRERGFLLRRLTLLPSRPVRMHSDRPLNQLRTRTGDGISGDDTRLSSQEHNGEQRGNSKR